MILRDLISWRGTLSALTLGLTALSGGMAMAEVIAEVPMSYSRQGHFLVELLVDGTSLTMIVDTGATTTTVLQNGVELAGLSSLSGGSAMVHGIAGNMTVERFPIAGLSLGAKTWRDIALVGTQTANDVLTSQSIEGILGVDLLGGFVLEFDQAGRVFRLHADMSDLDARVEGWEAIPIRPYFSGLTTTLIELNGTPVRALFDTGASRNVLNPAAGLAAGYGDGDARRLDDEPPVSGLPGTPSPAVRVEDVELRWGRLTADNQVFSISDAPLFRLLRLDGGPAAIAGIPLIAGRDFIVDYAGMMVWVES